METLGLSDSTPRTESRLKSLFWPSIQSGSDVDYLGTQGYWLCTLGAVLNLGILVAVSQPVAGAVAFLFCYLGGVGVRERSPYAAAAVLLLDIIYILSAGPGVLNIFMGALLLSNLRATWIAAGWKADSEAAILPPRLNETWGDKLADQLPKWLWPKLRIPYFIFSFGFLALATAGWIVQVIGRGK
jgi:hypothetical protein